MQAKGTIAKHKGTRHPPVVSPAFFWDLVFPIFWVLLGGEALKQTYSVIHGQPLSRVAWEKDVAWLVPLIGKNIYFSALWLWVWLIKAANSAWISRDPLQWEVYRRSILQDLLVTCLHFGLLYLKDYFNSLTGFSMSGHFLLCGLASAFLQNEVCNSKRYGGWKGMSTLVGVLTTYHWVTLFFTALVYHSFLESLSATIAALAISHIVYFN
jgi:hypothetical protein